MNLKLENTRYEIQSWLRLLDYQLQEIIGMKTQIAQVVKGDISKIILEQLEEFQNIFLSKETVISFCKRDILQLNDELESNVVTSQVLKTIREDMPKMEQEFNSLKRKFNECIGECLID